MKRNYCLSLVLLALFGVSAPFAANAAVESVLSSQSTQQAKKITGKVLDAAGEPIIGASVLVKGSGTGAVTDIDGNFSVEAPVGSTLEVSFIGYKTVTLKVTNATTYTVSLQDDSQALDEVVVTAMGIKKERKALGYSMEDVKSDELMKMKTANPISSLSGKVAGVNVTQSSGAAGALRLYCVEERRVLKAKTISRSLWWMVLFLITLHQWWAIRLSMVPCVLPLLLPIV